MTRGNAILQTRNNTILHASEISSFADALYETCRVFRNQGESFEAVQQNITNWITALNRTQGDEVVMPSENEEKMITPAWIIDDWDNWDSNVIVSDIGTKEFGSESLSEEPETHVSLDDVLRMRGL